MKTPDRTNWEAIRYSSNTKVYEYKGDMQKRPVFVSRTKVAAKEVADLLNEAYQKGREELMAELAELAKERGGIEHINYMLCKDLYSPEQCEMIVSAAMDAQKERK